MHFYFPNSLIKKCTPCLMCISRPVFPGFAIALAMIFSTPAATGEALDNQAARQPAMSNIPIADTPNQQYTVGMRPERDREAILLDTFNEAVRSGAAGALIKFISRNPDHALADKARRMLEEGSYPPARRTQTDFVDSKIVEFDAARRAGPDALKAFIAKHPGHPLAAEARRMLSK